MGLKSSTAAVVLVLGLTGCVDSRGSARSDFVTQLITEGGLDRTQATCVVDKFFETRSESRSFSIGEIIIHNSCHRNAKQTFFFTILFP